MASEPRVSLRQVTARIELEDYAKARQLVETFKDEGGCPLFKDMSSLVREAVHDYVRTTTLDNEHIAWIASEKSANETRRMEKRRKRKGFFSRIFNR